jgi:lipopolysaccharide exporter
LGYSPSRLCSLSGYPFTVLYGFRTRRTRLDTSPKNLSAGNPLVRELLPDRSAEIDQGAAVADADFSTVDLRALFARSLGWVGAARLITNAGTIVRYVVFARLVGPFHFGVFGAATFAEGLFRTLTDPSFARALVPQSGEIESFLDTVWFTMLAQGFAVSTVLVVAARPLASFFRITNAYPVFIAITPMALLISLQSPAVSGRIARSFDFRILFALDLADLLASLIVGGAIIVWLRDWRGLVAAVTAGQTARTVLSYWYFPYRPLLRFDLHKARLMFRFGRWVMLRRFADFASGNIDNLIVGHLLGPRPLGEYQLAFRLGGLPCSEVSLTAGVVVFPLTTRGHIGRKMHGPIFLSAGGIVIVVGTLYALVIRKWGAPLVALAVGSKWLDAYEPLKVLCWYGCARGVMVIGTQILDGLNAPAYSFSVTLVSTLILATFIYPLTMTWGTVGAAWTALISVVGSLGVMLRLYQKANREAR